MTVEQTATQVTESAALAPARAESEQILGFIGAAVDKGLTPDGIEKLVNLKLAVDRRNAELEFASALREFQRTCPEIPKNSTAVYPRKGGGDPVRLPYADLEDIQSTIAEPLFALGFSVTFDGAVGQGGMLTVTGTLRHINGHSTTSSFTLPTSNASPMMSDQQRFGSANTFAKRTVLSSLLGLRLADPALPEDEAGHEAVTEEQAATLRALVEEVKANDRRFLEWMGAESFEAIKAADYERAVKALEARRK